MAIEELKFKIPKPTSPKQEKHLFDFTHKIFEYSDKANFDDKHAGYILVTMTIDNEDINKDGLNDFIKSYYIGHKSI